MIFSKLVAVAGTLAAASLSSAAPSAASYPWTIEQRQQHVLAASKKGPTRNDVRNGLRDIGLIPDVIDDVLPALYLNVTWYSESHTHSHNESAHLGNFVDHKYTHDPPSAVLTALSPSNSSAVLKRSGVGVSSLRGIKNNLVFVITDADAPSHEAKNSYEFCHWIAVGLPVHLSNTDFNAAKHNKTTKPPKDGWLQEIVSYIPPSPPVFAGPHRYALLAYMPTNSTAEPLDLAPPHDRKNWGYGEDRHGVRDWANEMGLTLIAANFIQAENSYRPRPPPGHGPPDEPEKPGHPGEPGHGKPGHGKPLPGKPGHDRPPFDPEPEPEPEPFPGRPGHGGPGHDEPEDPPPGPPPPPPPPHHGEPFPGHPGHDEPGPFPGKPCHGKPHHGGFGRARSMIEWIRITVIGY